MRTFCERRGRQAAFLEGGGYRQDDPYVYLMFLTSLSHVVELRIDSSSIPLDLRLCSHLATLSRVCPCPCAFTAQHSVTRDMITDSREDLTNSVAAAVKEHKGKFRGLDCNRGTKTVMKR